MVELMTSAANFIQFLKELNVETVPSEMTFGVSRDHGAFEWAGTSLSALFAQPLNLLRPSMWRMIFDIVRFNYFALDLLANEGIEDREFEDFSNGHAGGNQNNRELHPGQRGARQTQKSPLLSIGEYLRREGYSEAFRDNYIIPMTACIWSTGPEKAGLEFPAFTLVRFMWNHHLLNTVSARPAWMTVKGCSQRYIDALLQDLPMDKIHLSSVVKTAHNDDEGKVVLHIEEKGKSRDETFDHVILACHGAQILDILSDSATETERSIFSAFTTTANVAYLHSDESVSTLLSTELRTELTQIAANASPSGDLGSMELSHNDR
jgi:predicted NAD/FAD-binding protein